MQPARARYRGVVFDLLTALLDSWSVWNAGAYRPYESIVAEAAAESGLDPGAPARLVALWGSIRP